MKKTFKTLLAFMLVCIMAVGLMGTMAFADPPEKITYHYKVGDGGTYYDSFLYFNDAKVSYTGCYVDSIAFSDGGENIVGSCTVADASFSSVTIPYSSDGASGTFKIDEDHDEIWVTFKTMPASVSCTSAVSETANGHAVLTGSDAASATASGGTFTINVPTTTKATPVSSYVTVKGHKFNVAHGDIITPCADFELHATYKVNVSVNLDGAYSRTNMLPATIPAAKVTAASGVTATGKVAWSGTTPTISDVVVTGSNGTLDAAEYTFTDNTTPANVTITKTNIDVKQANVEKVYDGTAVTPGEVTTTGLATGDKLTVTAYGTLPVNVADSGDTVIITAVSIKHDTDGDVSAYYNPVLNPGKATITPATVKVTANNCELPYDGTAHTANAYTATGLYGSDTLTVTYTGSRTNVGTSESTIATATVNGSAAGNYTVVTNPDGAKGSIKITPAALTITAKDAPSTEYTGNKITYSSTDVTKATVTGLKGSDTLTAIAMSSEGTSVNKYPVKITSYTISSGNDNYKVTLVDGKMEITKSSTIKGNVTVTLGATKPYDGAPLPSFYTVVIDADAKNAGIANVKVEPVSTSDPVLGSTAFSKVMGESDIKISFLKADGTAYTAPVNYSVVPGEVSITKLPLTITPSSVSKNFDGLPFVGKINAGKALAGTTINVTADAKPYNNGFYNDSYVPALGEHVLKVVEGSVKIINSLGQDVSGCFDVTYKDATLTVKASIGTANYSKSAGGTVSINCTMPNSLLAYVMVDGVKLTLDNDYTINKSVESTVITFRNSYLKNLDVGTHAVVYGYGEAGSISTKLTVTSTGATTSTAAPQTGDNSNIILWVVILAICLAGAVAIAVVLIRQKKNSQVEGQ